MKQPSSREFAPHPPPGGALGTSLKLWIVLTRAYESVARNAADDVAKHGLTIPEFGILEVLYHKGPVLLGEVQRRVLVSSGGTTFLVDRLASKGLVERRSCETDRRARYVALTPAGAQLITRIFPAHAARIARALRGLSSKEQQQVTAMLKTLGLKAAEGMAVDGAAPPTGTPRRRRTRKVSRTP
jgi:MarR family 2-MHQ and catechol resistance regulon transcriptional repressor